MNTKLILAILLICMAGLLFGSEIPADMDEMQRKTKELMALSERFKAETGFEMWIIFNYDSMELASFRGKFSDITISTVRDTMEMLRVFDRVMNKASPNKKRCF